MLGVPWETCEVENQAGNSELKLQKEPRKCAVLLAKIYYNSGKFSSMKLVVWFTRI